MPRTTLFAPKICAERPAHETSFSDVSETGRTVEGNVQDITSSRSKGAPKLASHRTRSHLRHIPSRGLPPFPKRGISFQTCWRLLIQLAKDRRQGTQEGWQGPPSHLLDRTLARGKFRYVTRQAGALMQLKASQPSVTHCGRRPTDVLCKEELYYHVYVSQQGG